MYALQWLPPLVVASITEMCSFVTHFTSVSGGKYYVADDFLFSFATS